VTGLNVHQLEDEDKMVMARKREVRKAGPAYGQPAANPQNRSFMQVPTEMTIPRRPTQLFVNEVMVLLEIRTLLEELLMEVRSKP